MVDTPDNERSYRRHVGVRTIVAVCVALVLSAAGAVLVLGGLTGGSLAQAAPSGATPRPAPVTSTTLPARPAVVASSAAPSTTTTTTTTAPAPAPAVATTLPVPAPATTAPTSGAPVSTTAQVAALVAQVEASGIDPGPTWTWSLGDTAACGAIPGTNVGTGCTSGAAGAVTTEFAGAPGLLLVAHELANAETENYAVPDLVSLVAGSAGGTSWSAIDAVASCLVVHFMGVQDGAAGPWQCPSALAATVGAAIHDPNFTG